mgnify:CR=1 FL=1|jgi:hypothetical protein|tara:strand:+ start:76 stop:291 length:216 start_codon:yes stop_codon:yes gene_type:complete
MNDIPVDYATLVEVMTVELNTYQSQLIALKAKLKIYDKELTEALNKVSELQKEKPATRKKSVNTDRDAGTY